MPDFVCGLKSVHDAGISLCFFWHTLIAEERISRKSNFSVDWNVEITRSVRNTRKFVGDAPAEISFMHHRFSGGLFVFDDDQ